MGFYPIYLKIGIKIILRMNLNQLYNEILNRYEKSSQDGPSFKQYLIERETIIGVLEFNNYHLI